MPSFNRIILCGNLVRDPELKYTAKGTAIARIGLAVNRNWTDANGEKKEEVTFVDCDAFGKTAETIGQYLTKGAPILIEGRLKMDQWEDKNTKEKRSKLGVVIETFQFLAKGTKKESSSESAKAPTPASKPEDSDDGVPF